MYFNMIFLYIFVLIVSVSANGLRGSLVKNNSSCPTSHICHGDVIKPCCRVCLSPKAKYISVDHGFGHPPFCGETCLEPDKYNVYHIFERNLTKAANVSNPCAHEYTPNGHKYSVYNSTVTHGWPGVLSVTLDLYGPDTS